MGNNGSSGNHIFCFRCGRICGRIVEPREKTLSICVSIQTATDNGSIDGVEEYTISQLCLCCASVILTEAVVSKKLIRPTSTFEGIAEKNEDDKNDIEVG